MSSIVQPLNQEQKISPYYQRLFQFNTTDARVYVSRISNSLLGTFTLGSTTDSTTYTVLEDAVLDGMESTYSLNSNILTVNVSPGIVIQDLTQLLFEEETTLTLDLSAYDPTGFVVLAINYQFLDTVTANPALLKLQYCTADGNTVLPDGWSVAKDRIILNKFTFIKSGSVITSVTSTCPRPLVHAFTNPQTITVKSNSYRVGSPLQFMQNIWNNLRVYPNDIYDGDTTYTSDDQGNITLVSKDLPDGTFNETYTYDSEGKILESLRTLSGTNHSKTIYTYDSNGDIADYEFITY
jgi:hypothetical protein